MFISLQKSYDINGDSEPVFSFAVETKLRFLWEVYLQALWKKSDFDLLFFNFQLGFHFLIALKWSLDQVKVNLLLGF